MSRLLRTKIEEASSFFDKYGHTDNEMYLLNIILDIGKEYNKLIDEYNDLLMENKRLRGLLNKKIVRYGRENYPYV